MLIDSIYHMTLKVVLNHIYWHDGGFNLIQPCNYLAISSNETSQDKLSSA